MKKQIKIIVTTILIISAGDTFCQNTFLSHYSSENSVDRCRIIEIQNEGYVTASRSLNNNTSEYYGNIIKYNYTGQKTDSCLFNGPNGGNIGCIQKSNDIDKIIIGGSIDSIGDNIMYRTPFIGIIDNDLHLLNKFVLSPRIDTLSVISHIVQYSDNVLFVLEQVNNIYPLYISFRVHKINLLNGTIQTYIPQENSHIGLDLMYIPNTEKIVVFYHGSSKTKYNVPLHILELDDSLQLINCIEAPYYMYLYAHSKILTDTSYLLSTLGFTEYEPLEVCRSIYLYEMSNEHDSINGIQFYPEFPEDSILYPFQQNNIALSEDNIIIGGQYNIVPIQYPTQPTPCWVQLTLFDYDLNMEKQLYYGDGVKAYYGMDIIATSDGGFAMCGLVNDPQNTTNPQPDMFVLKVNSEGLMTGNNEVEQPEVTEVILWPNPGNDVIHLKSASQLTNASFELYNPSGILCLTQKLSAGTHQTINTEHLTAGIYPYRIINGNRVVKTGKWIKK